MTQIEVAGRTLELLSLDKVLWPQAGFTKGDMVDYYRRIGPALMRRVAGRPVTLGRFPDGVDRYGWGVAEELAASYPIHVLATLARALRTGKVFIDWGQNAATKSTISAYSLRGAAWPLVSTPLSWDEVEATAQGAAP